MTLLLQDMLLFSFNSLDSLKMGAVGIEDFKVNMKGKAGKLDEDQSRKLVSVRVCVNTYKRECACESCVCI